jgi:hypothetical protein
VDSVSLWVPGQVGETAPSAATQRAGYRGDRPFFTGLDRLSGGAVLRGRART